VKRFGEEKFRALFAEEFARLRGLTQRPWEALDWRDAGEAAVARTPAGVLDAHDGSKAVVVDIPLGLISTERLHALADITEEFGVTELRTTRDQNLVFLNVAPARVAALVAKVQALGFNVPAGNSAQVDVVSCPGTTTCRIGITNSQTLGRHLLKSVAEHQDAQGLAVRVSGCQNSCGLHHVGEIGFHGMAKKIDGKPTPHYQLHVGGDPRLNGAIGIGGPIIHAKLAPEAVKLLSSAYRAQAQGAESLRDWAQRVGKAGIEAALISLESAEVEAVDVDWGDDFAFPGAPTLKGECAAPFVLDDLYEDQADDGLISFDRFLFAGRRDEAVEAALEGTTAAGRRLLAHAFQPVTEEESAESTALKVRTAFASEASLLAALDQVEGERAKVLAGAEPEAYREALAVWIDSQRDRLTRPYAPAAVEANYGALEDFDLSSLGIPGLVQ